MEATLDPVLHAAPSTSTRVRWAARVLGAVPVLFLALDGVMKLVGPAPVVEANARLGLPAETVLPIALVELACLLFYVIPRTAALGAVLLTGFLGGAVAMHARLGDPLLSHTIFPVYVAAMLWGSLYLRDARVRALVGR
jgi:hypothetical protein